MNMLQNCFEHDRMWQDGLIESKQQFLLIILNILLNTSVPQDWCVLLTVSSSTCLQQTCYNYWNMCYINN